MTLNDRLKALDRQVLGPNKPRVRLPGWWLPFNLAGVAICLIAILTLGRPERYWVFALVFAVWTMVEYNLRQRARERAGDSGASRPGSRFLTGR